MQKSFALLIIACFLIVLAAGCTSSAGSSAVTTQTAIATKTLAKTMVKTAPIADQPIVGAWMDYNLGTTYIERFFKNGTYLHGVIFSDNRTLLQEGTWTKQADGTVITTKTTGATSRWIYIPDRDVIYDSEYQGLYYIRIEEVNPK
jgi:hypothetical protein